MSQKAEILEYLQHRSITPMDALKDLGCFRLAARVDELRRDGHDIVTNIEQRGEKKFARYYLNRR